MKTVSTQVKILKYFFSQWKWPGLMRVLELTFNRPPNHVYLLEISKFVALIYATELSLVSKTLIPFFNPVKGNKIYKIKAGLLNCFLQVSFCIREIAATLTVLRSPHSPPLHQALLEALSGSGHREWVNTCLYLLPFQDWVSLLRHFLRIQSKKGGNCSCNPNTHTDK